MTNKNNNDKSTIKSAFNISSDEAKESIKDPKKVKLEKNVFRVSGDGVFFSLQGEGVSMGLPAVFLRLHVCNLKCIWCDSYYTWNSNCHEFWTESQQWTIKKTADTVEAVWGVTNPKIQRRLIITGGEPLLHKQQIDQLMDCLGSSWTYEIETNGTILPTHKQLKTCQFNCSPKLKNSKNLDSARINYKAIKALVNVNTTFKFVVSCPNDIAEIDKEWVGEMKIPVEKIILIPQGVTANEVRSNAQKIVEIAKTKGFRLLGRLQNEIWGAKRGV